MNKKILLPIILISILIMPFALALNFDWLFGTFNFLTGRIVEGTEPVLLNEQVKCSFIDSSSMQTCYTDDDSFKCSGTTECTSAVSGESGKVLIWKSSCGNELLTTTIDGNNEEVVLKCPRLTPTPVPPAPVSEPTNMEQVREMIKCTFLNSNTYQKCYTSDWRFTCSGLGSCSTVVYGVKDAVFTWKSSCGSEKSAIIDGQDNEVAFDCPQATQITPAPPSIMPTPVPPTTQTCTDSDGGINYDLKGTVKPSFSSERTDYCSDDKTLTEYYCQDNGDGRSITQVHWCQFGCKDGVCLPVPSPVCGNDVCESDSEKTSCPDDCRIKCYKDSDCEQSDKVKSCGSPMMAPSPRSTQYPNNYYACTSQQTSVCENPGTENAICRGGGSVSCMPCPLGCERGECIGTATPASCTDSDGIDYYVQGKACADANCEADRCEGNTILEYVCDGNFARIGSTYGCPNGCSNGACIKGESISEQITCRFMNSDKEQQCYVAGPFNAGDEGKKLCKGKDFCILNYPGFKGEQVTLKSSCGGYQSTVLDGQNNEEKFECKTGETNFAEIKNKGFRFAYWQCYDGTETKTASSGDGMPCKPSEEWQKAASISCNDKCYSDNSKCGVNSFSISGECYAEGMVATPTATTVPTISVPTQTTEAKVQSPKQGILYYFRDDNCQYCQKMDNEIGLLKQKGFYNNFEAAGFNINEPGISEKFGIKVAPAFILYKDTCSFKKEGFMTSDEVETWAYAAKCGEVTEAPSEKIIEPILICKDSCPLDGKCYPFGYRKSDQFCSDKGNFIEQSEADTACDNNFECDSNVCIDSKCISSGLIQKILKWFRNFF